MSNLALIKSEPFGNVTCDFYQDKQDEVWMTREQIGQALGYTNPARAISDIHSRNKDRLDQFSVVRKMRSADGKAYDTYLYSARGVYEICRWSRMPKANAFYDFVYDVLEALRTKRATISTGKTQKSAEIIRLDAETRARNARVREANIYRGLAKEFRNILSPPSIQQLVGLSAAVAHGKPVLPMPQIEKTYTAGEVGAMCGLSANAVGKLANKHGLKIAEYGVYVLDKSPHSMKQVQSWRYNEKGAARVKELAGLV